MIRHRRKLVLRRLTAMARLKAMRISRLKEREEQEILKEFPLPVYDIPFSSLLSMKSEERRQLRQQYKGLPAYMLMNKHEKRIFFKRKAKEYERRIKRMPQRVCKTTKSVQFVEEYDVKPFCKDEKASSVARAPTFKETYTFEHFRC